MHSPFQVTVAPRLSEPTSEISSAVSSTPSTPQEDRDERSRYPATDNDGLTRMMAGFFSLQDQVIRLQQQTQTQIIRCKMKDINTMKDHQENSSKLQQDTPKKLNDNVEVEAESISSLLHGLDQCLRQSNRIMDAFITERILSYKANSKNDNSVIPISLPTTPPSSSLAVSFSSPPSVAFISLHRISHDRCEEIKKQLRALTIIRQSLSGHADKLNSPPSSLSDDTQEVRIRHQERQEEIDNIDMEIDRLTEQFHSFRSVLFAENTNRSFASTTPINHPLLSPTSSTTSTERHTPNTSTYTSSHLSPHTQNTPYVSAAAIPNASNRDTASDHDSDNNNDNENTNNNHDNNNKSRAAQVRKVLFTTRRPSGGDWLTDTENEPESLNTSIICTAAAHHQDEQEINKSLEPPHSSGDTLPVDSNSDALITPARSSALSSVVHPSSVPPTIPSATLPDIRCDAMPLHPLSASTSSGSPSLDILFDKILRSPQSRSALFTPFKLPMPPLDESSRNDETLHEEQRRIVPGAPIKPASRNTVTIHRSPLPVPSFTSPTTAATISSSIPTTVSMVSLTSQSKPKSPILFVSTPSHDNLNLHNNEFPRSSYVSPPAVPDHELASIDALMQKQFELRKFETRPRLNTPALEQKIRERQEQLLEGGTKQTAELTALFNETEQENNDSQIDRRQDHSQLHSYPQHEHQTQYDPRAPIKAKPLANISNLPITSDNNNNGSSSNSLYTPTATNHITSPTPHQLLDPLYFYKTPTTVPRKKTH